MRVSCLQITTAAGVCKENHASKTLCGAFLFVPGGISCFGRERCLVCGVCAGVSHSAIAAETLREPFAACSEQLQQAADAMQGVQAGHEVMDKAVYGGGNGSSQAEAGALLPFIGAAGMTKSATFYNGAFRDSEGKLQLRVLPVYFRVK